MQRGKSYILVMLSVLLPGIATASTGPNAEKPSSYALAGYGGQASSQPTQIPQKRIKGQFLDLAENAPGEIDDLLSVYAGFGVISAQNCIDPEFSGQYYDSESGLHYNYKRYYDPGTGRYISVDPARDGHDYGYVDNNPFRGYDPYGLRKIIITEKDVEILDAVGTAIAKGDDLADIVNLLLERDATRFIAEFIVEEGVGIGVCLSTGAVLTASGLPLSLSSAIAALTGVVAGNTAANTKLGSKSIEAIDEAMSRTILLSFNNYLDENYGDLLREKRKAKARADADNLIREIEDLNKRAQKILNGK